MNWQSMESAPKDRRIVVWCDHSADDYFDHTTQTLSTYGMHCDGGNGHASDGLQVVEWQDGYEEGSYEEGYYHIPGWWFVVDTDCEIVANPVAWIDQPGEIVMSENNQPIDVNLLKVKMLELLNEWCDHNEILKYGEFSEEDMPPNMVSINNDDGSVMIEFPDIWEDQQFLVKFEFLSGTPQHDGAKIYDVILVKVLTERRMQILEFHIAQVSRYSSWCESEVYSVFEVEHIKGPVTIQLPKSVFTYTETLRDGTSVEYAMLEDAGNHHVRLGEGCAKIVN